MGWGVAVLGWSLLAGLAGMAFVTYGRDSIPAD
jgi:hypothetical protein